MNPSAIDAHVSSSDNNNSDHEPYYENIKGRRDPPPVPSTPQLEPVPIPRQQHQQQVVDQYQQQQQLLQQQQQLPQQQQQQHLAHQHDGPVPPYMPMQQPNTRKSSSMEKRINKKKEKEGCKQQ